MVTPTQNPTPLQRWLERRQWARDENRSFSIALDCPDRSLCAELAPKVAKYLSDVESGSPSGWLYFDPNLLTEAEKSKDLAETIAAGSPPDALPGCCGSRCRLLSDIAKLGGAVLYLPDTCKSLHDHPDLFVVGLLAPGTAEGSKGDLTIDLSRIDKSVAVRMIADSALEWAADEASHRNSPA